VGYAALEDQVRRWARRALADQGWHAIEDAVADSCAAIVVGIAQARAAETFAGFAYGHFLNVRQRLWRRAREPVTTFDEFEAKAPEAPGPAPDELDLLRECLDGLPARERQSVQLRYYEDAGSSEIAARLGVSEQNARRIVANGIARLRDCARRRWPAGRG
jgi:RNA polymerase sigma factor (sigma-70 family)